MDNLADIFKSIGIHERKFSRLNTKLANDINNRRYKKLDYFTGSEDDKSDYIIIHLVQDKERGWQWSINHKFMKFLDVH